MSQFAVILAAAGKSSRFGDSMSKKVFANVAGKPLWMYSAEAFSRRDDVAQLLLVISPEDKELFKEKFAASSVMLGIQLVIGGAERADSVRNGLEAVRPEISWVAVHDAARPCIDDASIQKVFQEAKTHRAAILATPCNATLKRTNAQGRIEATVPRQNVWLAQTPQVFHKELLTKAYAAATHPDKATDEASLVEAIGQPVYVVEGSPMNIKVTTKPDLKFVELALKSTPKSNPFPFL